ncbi:MAG: HPr family phosphocarrier protein [Oscillospiraceae bacterium]|nr:HPr family phosphocarrier protein [Oscillospiraceae bacterium]
MQTVYVNLPTAEAVHAFVIRISPLAGQFDLLSGRHVFDAKSLMSILTLDLTKPIELRVEKDTEETMRAIKQFITDEPAVL